jgi:glycerophosphoryl diester phosphodiesterase
MKTISGANITDRIRNSIFCKGKTGSFILPMRTFTVLKSLFFFVLSWTVVCGQTPVAVSRPIVVIAHRGNHEQVPENSLESLQKAIEIGVDYVETDIRTTRDGHLVIMHDGTVNRTTTGTGKVAELTLSQWKQLRLKNSSPAVAPPTFEELLQAAQGKIKLYLDVKDANPESIRVLLQKYHMETSVVIYTEPEMVQAWRKVTPNISVMISAPDHLQTLAALEDFVRRYPVDMLDGSVLFYTREKVDWLHQHEIQVWPDIQNPGENPVQWKQAIDLGVNALQTDHPSSLIHYLKTIHAH